MKIANESVAPERLLDWAAPALVAGFVVATIVVIYAVSFAALVFSGSLQGHLGGGIGIALFSTLVVAATMALGSSYPGAIGTPQDIPAVTLGVVAAEIAAKIAVAFVALAGIAGAAVAAQADSRRDGGPSEATQQAYGMHHGGGHHSLRHGEGRHGGGRHMFGMLESFDANDDGKLSQEESDQTRGERFGKFDADADKALTLGEYEQLWLDAMRERMVDRFQDLDADGDAKVTAEEFQRPFSKMVRRMDQNADGVIDRGDFQRHQPSMPTQGGPTPDDNG